MPEKIGDFIICPYCNSTHPDMCDYPEGLASGGEEEMNCWECGKLFTVTCEVSYTFYANEKKEEKESTCPSCGKRWDFKTHNACQCGAIIEK